MDSPIAAILDFVADVVAIDQLTVRFDLKSPNAYLPDLVSLYHARILPSDVDVERLATEEFGTGPFMLKEHVPGERIVMVRNPDYWWEGYPYLDEIVIFPISDPGTRANALMVSNDSDRAKRGSSPPTIGLAIGLTLVIVIGGGGRIASLSKKPSSIPSTPASMVFFAEAPRLTEGRSAAVKR